MKEKTKKIAIGVGAVLAAGALVFAASTLGATGYTNEEHGFSFDVPRGFAVNAFAEGGSGETILVEGKEHGFQVFVSPFDEDVVLTEKRIAQDLPELELRDAESIAIGPASDLEQALGSRAAAGIAFVHGGSENESEESFEVWFVHGGNLYQISAFRASENIVRDMLQSWRFAN